MIFGLFKSKEARDIDKAKKFLKKALDNAKAIVLIDTKHHPEQILDLAVMFNKQIIISTHDERFYNLFKAKAPRIISKFLELESHGKVKSGL